MKYNNKRGSFAPRVKRRKTFIARKSNTVPYGRELHVRGIR
jgi:hypothetical protein